MPTRRTSSRRLSGGDRAALRAWAEQRDMADQLGRNQFRYKDRTYDRVFAKDGKKTNRWKCIEELSQPRGCNKRYSQSKRARVARKAAAAARKRTSDKKKAAAAERAFQREVRRISGPGISGGRKIRTGPRGGKYVLKGGKKVYL